MSSQDRFYQLDLRHREAYWGDIGNLIKIQGLLVGDSGASMLLLLPGVDHRWDGMVQSLTVEEWTEYLQRSDDPEVLIMPMKAFHRKLRYEISGFVQQKVWKADSFLCMYCAKPMGEVPLTIDHFIPLEMGGANDTSNYLSACRKCNKDKGGQDPREFCKQRKYDYEFYAAYLQRRRIA